MPYVKSKARVVRRRRPRVVRKARKGKGKPSMVSLARKVQRLSTKIKREAEVKYYTPSGPTSANVGQVNANATGCFSSDMGIMTIPQGLGQAGERVGNKVKLIGTSIRIQIQQQSACDFYNRYVIDVVGTTDMAATATTIRDRIYQVDSISGVVDANSTRDYSQLKCETNPLCDTFILASKRLVLGKDAAAVTQTGFIDVKMFIKSQTICQYSGSASNPPANIRYLIYARAQAGNSSASTASTLPNVVATVVSTGAVFRYTYTNYYTDD